MTGFFSKEVAEFFSDYPKFREWKKKVDIWINILVGMSSDDLPDWDYYGAYLSRCTPLSAARKAIRAVKDF